MQVKGRIDARNSLETYCYNMKSTIEDKLGDKISDDEKDKVCSHCLGKYFWTEVCICEPASTCTPLLQQFLCIFSSSASMSFWCQDFCTYRLVCIEYRC